jgi:hypothetical protein
LAPVDASVVDGAECGALPSGKSFQRRFDAAKGMVKQAWNGLERDDSGAFQCVSEGAC